MDKQLTYTTAYSPMYKCGVRIIHRYQDDRGEWIFVGRNLPMNVNEVLFRECELREFSSKDYVPNKPKAVQPTMMQLQTMFAAICDSDCPTPLALEIVRVGSNNGLPAMWVDVDGEYMPVLFELGEDGTVYCNGDSRW